MMGFWNWYLDSGRIDGQMKGWRRLSLTFGFLLVTALWLWLRFSWMSHSRAFFARVYSNPFTILSFVGLYVYTKSMEYLCYRVASTGAPMPSRGAFARNDGKVFEVYRLTFGEDAAYKLPRRLQIAYMASFFIAVVMLMLQGPFER